MPETGGPADKLGNYYEQLWTVKSMIDVLEERARSLYLEPLGPEGEGVEFRLLRNDGRREYHQVKRQYGKGGYWSFAKLESNLVLTRFREKLSLPDTVCVFVSIQEAYPLRDLAERTRSAPSFEDFRTFILNGKTIEGHIDELRRYWKNCTESEVFDLLKRIHSENISEQLLDFLVQTHLSHLVERPETESVEEDAKTAVDILAQLALKSIHQELTAHDIWHYLETRGYHPRNWGKNHHVLNTVRRKTDYYLAQLRKILIIGKLVPREETEVIIRKLHEASERQCVMLSGVAGGGKSTVLLQTLELLRTEGLPVFVFRVDQLKPTFDPDEIGQQLHLPGSPANVLAAIAQGRDCVLAIDQLDAVSMASGRNPAFFDTIEIVIQQALTYPRMHLVLACRAFDLENDPRFRRLISEEKQASAVPVLPLPVAKVSNVVGAVGFDPAKLSQKQIDLFSIPFHLNLLTEIAHTLDSRVLTIETANDLFSAFWDVKQAAVSARLGYEVPWLNILRLLVQTMSEQQRLFIHESKMLAYRKEVRAMVSEHVLLHENKQYGFFHESFFDYVFARLFAAQDKPLVSMLYQSEQHLFRRAQVRQVLLHRREADFECYLNDLSSLLNSPTIRFHLKQIVFAVLKDVAKPTEDEWNVLATFLNDSQAPYKQIVWQIFYGSPSWFRLLDRLGVISLWLTGNTPEHRDEAFLILTTVQKQEADRVAELVVPLLEWDGVRQQIVMLLLRSDLSMGRRFFEVALDCIDRGWFDETQAANTAQTSPFWLLLHDLSRQQPTWACEAIGRFLQRCLERSVSAGYSNPFDETLNIMPHVFPNDTTLLDSAVGTPMDFFKAVYPFIFIVMNLNARKEGNPPWQDVVWGGLYRSRRNGGTFQKAMLFAMETALSHLAQKTPEYYAIVAQILQESSIEAAHYLLMRGFTANAEAFADDAASYLCISTTCLEIGYRESSHWATRELLQAITPFCSEQLLARLEERLLHYASPYERSVEGYKWRRFGLAQLTLLEGIVPSRRSVKVQQRIEQWRRKFPGMTMEPPQPPTAIFGASIASSPLSSTAISKMSDAQLLKTLAHNRADLGGIRPDGTIVGGVFSISSQLAEQARLDPRRFATIAQRLPDDTPLEYFEAILRGIADAPIKSEELVRVCQKCHSLPGRPCGYWICYALAKRAEKTLPVEALHMVSWYATENQQVDPESWRTELDENLDHHTDPITATGKELIRGNAAEVIGHLIAYDPERVAVFLPPLERLAEDPSIAVRACTVLALQNMSQYDLEATLSIFLRLCQTEDALLQSSPVEHFLARAFHSHFVEVRPLLRRMLQSPVTGVARVGARLACVAALITEQAQPLAEACLVGSEAQRIGMAEICAAHLVLAPFRPFCEKALMSLFNDSSEQVRAKAVKCFEGWTGSQLGGYERLIEVYVQSPTFMTNPHLLIQALKEASVQLPEITCIVCEKYLDMMSTDDGKRFLPYGIRGGTIDTLLLRVYSQQRKPTLQTRCLDLIDRVLQYDDQGLSQILGEYDR